MRTLALALTTLCLVAGAVHMLRPPVPPPPSHTLTVPRRATLASAAPSHGLVSTLTALCPRVALPGRRVVVTATQPHVALAVHPSGEQISDALATGGEWDGWGGGYLMEVVRNQTVAGMAAATIIDAGANIGALAVRWAAAGATVHAFEAASANADLLECSSKLNGAAVARRLVVHRAALGDTHGQRVCMETVPQNMGMSSVKVGGDGGTACVPTTTIDHHVQTHAATFSSGLSLLKIDVEGFEPALLVGAQTTLSSPTLAPRVIALEVSVDRWRDRFGATAGEVLALIVRHGYDAVFPPEAVGGFEKLVAFCEKKHGRQPRRRFREKVSV